ncbi:DNA polymerase III subunit alpha [Marinilongibacter aquaticus]|uniref:DNA polymerase III subunit alpha n=1 Tax=Marinilongibacter aquaticus TaxID=2975157 RepID=UPI0021BD752C|nr:DNA polymerase III subunit alpha [Marinilongibacter aquaticus]UBM60383.1 DNA polymerase III subunit alpha [Marinilongibacter aquaticus]
MYLNCHTYFSLRYGTFSEEELLKLAAENGQKTLALTDINNTSACLNFVRTAPKYGIKPVLGVDFRNGNTQLFVGVAKNNRGFQELNAHLSFHKHAHTKLPEKAPAFQQVQVIYPLSQLQNRGQTTLLSHEYIGVGLDELEYLHRSPHFEHLHKMVFLHAVTFRNKVDFNLHRLLRAIDNNELLSRLPNSEQGHPEEKFIDESVLSKAFEQYPLILENTRRLLDACHIHFDFNENRPHQNLLSYTGERKKDYRLIQKLVREGLSKRYGPQIGFSIKRRVIKELKTISQMDYVAFFLVNWDIIQYAKSKGYFHVGRGSGANSIVAYLLGITDVDPIELDLYFERFMNLYRANPPDFDIDFSSKDRDDITRYIFERFGKNKQVALLATYNTFQYSAAVRELGKVFGLPKDEIDTLSDGKYDPQKLDKLSQLVIQYAHRLNGIPNILSVHSSGIIISEKSLHYFSATDMPPKGFPTVQFDMVIAEDVGLYKYDILGQRGLGKIKDSLAIIQENRPEAPHIDIHNAQAFLKDKAINEQISKAQCIGCFYVESPAMRMLLRKLEVDNYLGLVAASSIIRPGVAKSGMMREYILRHRDPKRREEAHPKMIEIMNDTYGVMVYQEDVIKVAHYFAGLSLAEADQLRRGMSGKYRSREEFAKVKRKFIQNCRDRGEEEKTIQEVWNQTESFAGYAFAKGHSASYAIESYQSLFLKTYYPLEFMVAVLNNGGGFYRTELYVHEARMQGGLLHAPQINLSRVETIIRGQHIYLGFQHLAGLESHLALQIVAERQKNGAFLSLADFLERIDIAPDQMEILLRIGSFDFTGINKRELLWQALYKLNKEPKRKQSELFKVAVKQYDLPKLSSTFFEDTFDQMELLGFPLCNPFDLLLEKPENTLAAKDMPHFVNREMTIYAYLITIKNTSTSRGSRMQFGTFLDHEGHWVDTVHFPPVAAKFPFRGKGVYQLTGIVKEEFDFYTLEIAHMQQIPYIPDPRFNTDSKVDYDLALKRANTPFRKLNNAELYRKRPAAK